MPAADVLLSAIAADPADNTAWLALADCLDEEGEHDRADLVRLREWLRHAPADHPERRPRESRMQHLLGAGVEPAGPRWLLPVTKRSSLELALIPAGSFLMGSAADEEGRSDDEGPRHPVTLTRAFYLAVHPITQSRWRAVMGDNPSRVKRADRPVERVSWDDCQEFCHKLSRQTGRKCRLPTEAEWEYACRAGTTSPFHFGDGITTDQANYDGNYTYGTGPKGLYRQQATPVGGFPPNAWGLRDMHGNVWEWCQDGLRTYRSRPVSDPLGRDKRLRAVRGGSWFHLPKHCRCACRIGREPTGRGSDHGFRVLLTLD